jgi:hypothetical protein
MNGRTNPLVSSAATDISSHGLSNLLFTGLGLGIEKGHGGHDLSRLAVAALGNIGFHPGLLDRMRAVFADVLDGAYLGAGNGTHGHNAGPHRLPPHVDRTSSTQANAATELGSRQSQNIPQVPEQWHFGIPIKPPLDTIHLELNHRSTIAEMFPLYELTRH